MKIIDWKEEAQKQASAAGTLKIKLAFRLDDINTRLITLKKILQSNWILIFYTAHLIV